MNRAVVWTNTIKKFVRRMHPVTASRSQGILVRGFSFFLCYSREYIDSGREETAVAIRHTRALLLLMNLSYIVIITMSEQLNKTLEYQELFFFLFVFETKILFPSHQIVGKKNNELCF
jgi:hypothetical protein